MDNPMIREQENADAAEDKRRRQAILEEHYCSMCSAEVGPDYTLCIEICCKCNTECCQHMGRFKDMATQEKFVCYECEAENVDISD